MTVFPISKRLDRYLLAMHGALCRMPDEPPRQVVEALVFEKLKPSEVAERMGITVARVYGLRKEALRTMRKMAADILASGEIDDA